MRKRIPFLVVCLALAGCSSVPPTTMHRKALRHHRRRPMPCQTIHSKRAKRLRFLIFTTNGKVSLINLVATPNAASIVRHSCRSRIATRGNSPYRAPRRHKAKLAMPWHTIRQNMGIWCSLRHRVAHSMWAFIWATNYLCMPQHRKE